MDVKYIFLKTFINEEVYISQSLDFEDHENHDHIFKLKRAFFDLKQAPIDWYECLSDFLLKKIFNHKTVDTTLFIKSQGKHIILV